MSRETLSATITSPLARHLKTLSLRNTSDLLILAALGLAAPCLLLLPVMFVRVPVGLIVALFVPGSALIQALFPQRATFDTPVRVALSFGISVAILPLLAVLLNLLPWGIRPWPIAIAIMLWTLGFCGIGILVRTQPGYIPDPQVKQGLHLWIRSRRLPIGMAVALFLLVNTISLVLLIVTTQNNPPRPTAFYAIGNQGLAEQYPRQVAIDDLVGVTVGIKQQQQSGRYRLEVWLMDRANGEYTLLTSQRDRIIVEPGEKREWPIQWRMPRVGNDQQVEIVLFSEEQMEPYRRLQLWLNVTSK
jgi:uncharacterized membrane protein